jgi:hypothetical protein
MKLRSVRIDKRFVPEWMNNKKLPVSEQVVIYFSRIPGTSEKQNYIDYSFNSKGQMSISYNDQMLVSSFVSKIDNLEIDISGSLEKIKNGVDLSQAAHHGLPGLFTEIRDYLFPSDEEIPAGESKA